jgi:hypothetical protein
MTCSNDEVGAVAAVIAQNTAKSVRRASRERRDRTNYSAQVTRRANGREAITTLASLTYSPALTERGNFAPSKPTDWPTRPAVPIRAASA